MFIQGTLLLDVVHRWRINKKKFFLFYLAYADDYGSSLTISLKISFSIFCILIIDIWNTNIVCVTAIVLSMGTQFVN